MKTDPTFWILARASGLSAYVLLSSSVLAGIALLLPGRIPYRPLWTGVGVLTAEIMLVIYLSFSARKLIGAKAWRRLHYATYAVFAAATAHGVMSGTDSAHPWVLNLYVGAVGAVVAATAWRVLAPPARASSRRRSADAVEG